MFFLDFTFDICHDRMIFDEEIKLARIGWNQGDMFQVTINSNGRIVLMKILPNDTTKHIEE